MNVLACLTPILPAPQFAVPVEVTRRFEEPSALLSRDFDGDGLEDLIGASGATGQVRFWKGDGSGGYARGEDLPVALSSIGGVSAGDLDGDGDLDLAASVLGPGVVWIENLGGGQFAPEIPIVGFGAPAPGSIVRERVVDFDGDGRMDVLMTFDRTSSVQDSLLLIAYGSGAGPSNVQTLISSPSALFDADAADLDGDGDLDVVVGGSDVGAWYRSDGAGTLSGPIALPLFSGAIDEQVAAADVNGDGHVDLVSMQCFDGVDGTVVYVSRGDGTGQFAQQMSIPIPGCVQDYVIEDVNGDGRADLIATESRFTVGAVWLALGSPAGPFVAPDRLEQTEVGVTALGLGDADGDGTWELVVGTSGGQVYGRESVPGSNPVALSDDVTEFTETLSYAFRDRLLDTADFNGDGLPDLLVLGAAEKRLGWWPADGGGGFSALQTIRTFRFDPDPAFVGDVDGDGSDDVVVFNRDLVQYEWLRGEGPGGLAAPAALTVPQPPFIASGLDDVNGDGLDDLVFIREGSFPRLEWSENLGSGNFGAVVSVHNEPDEALSPRFVDVNGDGLLDLAFLVQDQGAAPARFRFLPSTAPGVFAAPVDVDLFTPFPYDDNCDWSVADMDGDGELDLVVTVNAATPPARSRVMLYRGQGSNQFGAVSVLAGATQAAYGVELRDLDGDGGPDIVTRIPFVPGQEDGLVWYRNLNGSQFAPRESLISSQPINGEWLLGDYDGDGDVDAVFAEAGNDAVMGIETLYRGDIGTPYCSASVANSTGVVGELVATGSAIPGTNDLVLTANGLPLQSFGMFLASQTTDAVFAMNSVGVLCLGGAIGRFNGPGQITSSGTTGSITLSAMPAGLPTPQGPQAALAGETWHFQAWHRDTTAGGQPTSNFTRAVSVRFL